MIPLKLYARLLLLLAAMLIRPAFASDCATEYTLGQPVLELPCLEYGHEVYQARLEQVSGEYVFRLSGLQKRADPPPGLRARYDEAAHQVFAPVVAVKNAQGYLLARVDVTFYHAQDNQGEQLFTLASAARVADYAGQPSNACDVSYALDGDGRLVLPCVTWDGAVQRAVLQKTGEGYQFTLQELTPNPQASPTLRASYDPEQGLYIPYLIRINLSPRHFIPHDVCDADGWLSC